MRRAFSGFVCGYLMIAFVAMPAMLCALGKTSSFGGGVVMVLQETGVLGRVKDGVDQVAQTRNRLTNQLAIFIARKLAGPLPDSPDAAGLSVRPG